MSKKQEVQIHRMIEALEIIADMPLWQNGVSLAELKLQYKEAIKTARLALDLQRMITLDETGQVFANNPAIDAECSALRREASRGRTLASYILGRTEDLHNAPEVNAALTAIREKCTEEVDRA